MSQDNKKSFVMYQGDGSNNVFSVPMTKGKYGTISVAFVRRGLDQYEYNPDTWGLNGGLFAWDLSGTKVYTDTATPAIGATIYDQYGVDTGDTVTAVGGATITVNTNVYTRDALHDVDENTVLTWTGDTLQVGDYIVIERTTTRTQPFEFQNNQKHIEKSDDNLERQIQEVADKVDNALLVDPTHTIDSNKMNPVEWMKTILRSVDKSVRGFRYLNGWLDYSLDDPNIADVDKTWIHLLNTDNIKAIREQSRIEDGETIYWTEYLAQDGSWKILSRGGMIKLSDLADVDFTNLSAGNFIMFDGLKWKNVYSSATASWGTLLGNIDDQADLMNKFTEYVRTDGTSVMTAPLLMRATDDFKCAIAPYWDGVGFFKLNDNNSVTLMASIEYNSGFEPATTNTYNIGASARKWKNLYLSGKAYMSVINNGYDIAVPVTNSADTLALKSEVDLAANSGDQLTEKGVWYAKMYSATVAPSAEDGTNYADFSQVDGQGNPIIVIYKRQNGAWVQDQTITPPAEYNGYVPVTSKIWDIVEQAGQQGGKVLWSHNQKTFTPSPLIISFKDAALTGTPTAPTLNASSPSDQIVNKQTLENALANHGTGRNVGDVFYTMRNDNELNGAVECNGATYNTTDFIGAQSIGNLLAAGKIDYISLTDYATEISTKGWCDKIGWNGTGNTQFRVPTLNAHIVQTNNIPVVGNGMALGLINGRTNGNGVLARTSATDYSAGGRPATNSSLPFTITSGGGMPGTVQTEALGVTTEPDNSGIIADTSDTAQQRVMIQLATSATDEALETCTAVTAQVAANTAAIAGADYVVESQLPTAQNNYTWYRKYKSGWVEQGGQIPSTTASSTSKTVNLPITMTDTNYFACSNTGYAGNDAPNYGNVVKSKTTTTITVGHLVNYTTNWTVSGMSAS